LNGLRNATDIPAYYAIHLEFFKTLRKKEAVSFRDGSRTVKDAVIYVINTGIQGMEIKFKESTACHSRGVVVCHI
jgi:hypothetical protein